MPLNRNFKTNRVNIGLTYFFNRQEFRKLFGLILEAKSP
jgi:hypothetical protein